MSDNNPSVLVFHVKPTTTNAVIRSAPIKQYFQGLTSNVDVLYPTQANIGLLLCKAKRTQEKILNMQHIMNGATIQLSQLPRQIYDQTRSTLSVHSIQQIGPLMQQYLPFLDASGGRIHNNQDGSVTLESNVYLLNAINSFMLNKLSQKSNQSHSTNEPIALKSGNEPIISKSLNEPIILKSGTVTTKVMCGKLLEQKVEGILIPTNDRYIMHAVFDQQLQRGGGSDVSQILKELAIKGIRAREGELIPFPNREVKVPARYFFVFIVPHLNSSMLNPTSLENYQPTYELLIYKALTTIDSSKIVSLAMPILKPVETEKNRSVTDLTTRAMISAIKQFSLSKPASLRKLSIVDHELLIKPLTKRLIRYKNITSKHNSRHSHHQQHHSNPFINPPPIQTLQELNMDDEHSFPKVFSVPAHRSRKEEDSDIATSDEEYDEPSEYLRAYDFSSKPH